MALKDIRPLQQGLPFGIRIGGVSFDEANDPAVRAELADLFEQHGMIVFEDVEPSDRMQVALSEAFGPLKEHPVKSLSRVEADTMPGVIKIAVTPEHGGIVEIGGKPVSHWLPWHFDHCYNNELNRAGVLRAIDIVEDGGITGFADGIALYNAFPKDLLARIEGTKVLYSLATQYEQMIFGKPEDMKIIRPKPMNAEFQKQAAAMPRAIHPAVWTRASGEKVLHVSAYMSEGIDGAENAEGNALLEEVAQTINRLAASCSYHHHWKHSDLLIWDNWRMLHSVSGNSPAESRTMHRTTIKGDYGLGRFENDGIGGKILSETMV
jgi:taurine dioxygenase